MLPQSLKRMCFCALLDIQAPWPAPLFMGEGCTSPATSVLFNCISQPGARVGGSQRGRSTPHFALLRSLLLLIELSAIDRPPDSNLTPLSEALLSSRRGSDLRGVKFPIAILVRGLNYSRCVVLSHACRRRELALVNLAVAV